MRNWRISEVKGLPEVTLLTHGRTRIQTQICPQAPESIHLNCCAYCFSVKKWEGQRRVVSKTVLLLGSGIEGVYNSHINNLTLVYLHQLPESSTGISLIFLSHSIAHSHYLLDLYFSFAPICSTVKMEKNKLYTLVCMSLYFEQV